MIVLGDFYWFLSHRFAAWGSSFDRLFCLSNHFIHDLFVVSFCRWFIFHFQATFQVTLQVFYSKADKNSRTWSHDFLMYLSAFPIALSWSLMLPFSYSCDTKARNLFVSLSALFLNGIVLFCVSPDARAIFRALRCLRFWTFRFFVNSICWEDWHLPKEWSVSCLSIWSSEVCWWAVSTGKSTSMILKKEHF